LSVMSEPVKAKVRAMGWRKWFMEDPFVRGLTII